MELYIARHGQTFGNIGEDSSCDPALTPLGLRQVQLLGERMANIPLDCIIASPLQRAVQTAQAVAERQNGTSAVEILPEVMEFDPEPGFMPQDMNTLRTICPTAIPCPFSEHTTVPPETWAEGYERAKWVIEQLHKRFSGETTRVFIAAHGHFNNLLLHAATGIPIQEHFNFSQYNGCLNLVRFITWEGHAHTQFTFFNNHSHLPLDLITGT